MRILHVISDIDPRAGGPSAALAGLVSAQARDGLDVRVISTWAESAGRPGAEVLDAIGAPVQLIGPAAGKLRKHHDLPRAVENAVAVADVIHIHALWEEIQHRAARSARRRGVPYVFRPCGMLDPWSLSQNRWVKQLYLAWRLCADLNHAAAIHYTAAAERDLAAPLNLRPPAIVESNGVKLEEFDPLPPAGAFRSRYPQLGERPFALFLSRVHPKKGLDLLIPAFARAGTADAMLVIAGPGEADYIDQLKRVARNHGIENRILFTGMLYGVDRVAALADADLFVLPSHQENFGIAVVEALAAGTPVVISDQVNIFDQIVAAGVGEAVPLDESKLAGAVGRWLRDSTLRRAAAERARPFVWEHYDWRQIARRWTEHYRALLGVTATPASRVGTADVLP